MLMMAMSGFWFAFQILMILKRQQYCSFYSFFREEPLRQDECSYPNNHDIIFPSTYVRKLSHDIAGVSEGGYQHKNEILLHD